MSTKYELPNIHPGEMLLEDFMKPMGITAYRLATDIGVPINRIDTIIHGKRSISPDTAIRLGRYFGMSAEFWLNAQAHYDLMEVRRSLDDKIENITPYKETPQGKRRQLANAN